VSCGRFCRGVMRRGEKQDKISMDGRCCIHVNHVSDLIHDCESHPIGRGEDFVGL
jgi:hypothetical protein